MLTADGREIARLDRLLADVKRRWSSSMKPTRLSEADFDVFRVCTSWLRQTASYAEAVRLMAGGDVADAAPPTLRAMLELWAEFLYLLDEGTRSENATKIEITGILEMSAFARQHPEVDGEQMEGVARQLTRLRSSYPSLVSICEQQRKQHRFHWSGLSRSVLIERAWKSRDIYGLMSWDAHPLITSLRDLDVDTSTNTLTFQPKAFLDADAICYQAGGYLFFMFNRHAKEFGFEPLPPFDE
jgi:hypothetical protein